MKVILKSATIVDPSSSLHGKSGDLLIENGVIKAFETSIEDSEAQIVSGEHLHVSQGWVDLKAHFCDPGEEHKSTIQSGLDAAAAGGFTHVAVFPTTKPVLIKHPLNTY
jgi:dihydroorotase